MLPLLSEGPVAGQQASDEAAEEANQLPPEISDAEWEAAVKRFQALPIAMTTQGLTLEQLEEAAKVWSADLGLDIEIESQPLISILLENSPEVAFKDDSGMLHTLELDYVDFDDGQPGYFRLLEYSEVEEGYKSWRIPAAKLAPLRYPVVENVVVRHPLNKRVPKLEVVESNVVEVIQNLIGLAGVEYSIAVPKEPATVSLRLTNRTVAECLKIVTSTVGWSIAVGSESITWQVFDDSLVSQNDARESLLNKEYLNLIEDAKVDSLLNAYRYRVYKVVKPYSRSETTVRVFQPAPEAESK